MNPLGQYCQKVFVNLRTEQKNPLRVNYQNSNKKSNNITKNRVKRCTKPK